MRNGGGVSPLEFGGDPTGRVDSTKSLQRCIEVCVSQATDSPNGLFPGSRSFGNGRAIRDMGGCRVDLGGGEFLISAPIVIPEYNGNMQLGSGSLVASKNFSPLGGFMLVVGDENSTCSHLPQGSCNVDVNFPELFLDGSHVASTMQVNHVMGVTIGPGGYFLNFTGFGLQINAGHEVMIDRCWLGETNFDFDFVKEGVAPKATAIQVNGNDHYILNTIVFSSRIGIEVNGAADYIQGVHVWFPMNVALAYKDTGAMAFHVTESGNRFNGCYIDGGRAVFTGKGLQGNVWTNGFECCAVVPGVNHGLILSGDEVGPGLHITHNMFAGGSIWHETTGGATAVSDVRIEANFFRPGGKESQSPARAKSTKASIAQTSGTPISAWSFDFCAALIFPNIAIVRSITITAEPDRVEAGLEVVSAQALPTQGCRLQVVTSRPVVGTIFVEVDSSVPQGSFEAHTSRAPWGHSQLPMPAVGTQPDTRSSQASSSGSAGLSFV